MKKAIIILALFLSGCGEPVKDGEREWYKVTRYLNDIPLEYYITKSVYHNNSWSDKIEVIYKDNFVIIGDNYRQEPLGKGNFIEKHEVLIK